MRAEGTDSPPSPSSGVRDAWGGFCISVVASSETCQAALCFCAGVWAPKSQHNALGMVDQAPHGLGVCPSLHGLEVWGKREFRGCFPTRLDFCLTEETKAAFSQIA